MKLICFLQLPLSFSTLASASLWYPPPRSINIIRKPVTPTKVQILARTYSQREDEQLTITIIIKQKFSINQCQLDGW